MWGLMALGGIVGAVVNTVSSVVSQVATEGSVNWKSVAVAAGSGFVSGAISASPIGLVGQVVLGGVTEGATYIADCWVTGESVSIGKIALNSGFGAVSGLLGGPGANENHILSDNLDVANKVIKSNKSKSTKYAAKMVSLAKSCRREIVESVVSDTAVSGVMGNISSSFINGSNNSTTSYDPYAFRYARLM